MNKMVFAFSGLFLMVQAFAQNAQPKAFHKTAQSGPTISAEKSKMLCKAWKLDSVEQFGVVQKASAKQANDGVTFTADGNFFYTSEGAAVTGTWKGNAAPYINTVAGTPEVKKMFKLISLSDNKLKLEYQTEDLIRITYTYSPKN